MIGTSSFLAALGCTKFVFGRGSAGPLAGLTGDPTSKGKESEREGGERGRPPDANSWIRH